jgi:hypothetical protein
MKNYKRDLPIYALSISLVFLGISISTNQASAVYKPNTAKIAALQSQLSSFKNCSNSNFRELMFYDADRQPKMLFIRSC